MQAALLNRIELPNDLGAVSLFDWMAEEYQGGRNLIRTTIDGIELWRAEPPLGQNDCFTQIARDGEALIAWTWSGFKVKINLANGAVTTLTFTK